MIPPLLQTPAYARLALTRGRDAPEDEAATIRMEAQAVLHEEGRRFSFLLLESAVRTRPGPASLMPAQLDRLAQVAALPHVRIGVILWTAPAAVFLLHGFSLYDGTAIVFYTRTCSLTITSTLALV